MKLNNSEKLHLIVSWISLFIIILLLVIKDNISILEKQLSKNLSLMHTQTEIVKSLKIYTASDENGDLKLIRHGRENDGGYIVAEKSLLQADVLLGYGINTDNSFEDEFSLKYNKPSYGFDCGINNIESKSNLFHFVRECISSDKFLNYGATSNNQITSFNTQINKLNLNNKKLFIKMDIEGAEYEAFPEIIDNAKNITGITLEIHFDDNKDTKKALHLLKSLEKDFILIHVHGNNCTNFSFETPNSIGAIPTVIELTYINKRLVKEYKIAKNQSHPTNMDQINCRKPEAEFTIID